MKSITSIIILAFVLLSSGCGKDAEANALMKQYSEVADEIVRHLDEDDVDSAREVFEENKDSLDKKWQYVKVGLPFQFSDATKKKMKSETQDAITAVTEAGNKAIKRNPKSEQKIQALALDMANVFRK